MDLVESGQSCWRDCFDDYSLSFDRDRNVLRSLTAPVAKIESRSCPFEGSKGPGVNVSELRTIASPRPSPRDV